MKPHELARILGPRHADLCQRAAPILHYRLIATTSPRWSPPPRRSVLDYGCGEALSADRVAARCAKLYLCDGAPSVREKLVSRFGDEPNIVGAGPRGHEPDRRPLARPHRRQLAPAVPLLRRIARLLRSGG
jgi:hypothetical protein